MIQTPSFIHRGNYLSPVRSENTYVENSYRALVQDRSEVERSTKISVEL